MGLLEHVAGAGGASDRCAVGLPLVTDRPEAIRIGQGLGGREGLPLAGQAADRHRAGGGLIEVLHHNQHLAHGERVVLAIVNGVAELQRADVGRVVTAGIGVERPAAIPIGDEPITVVGA